MHEKILFSCLMIILEQHLKLDIEHYKVKKSQEHELKYYLQKVMERLPILLAETKAGNTSKKLINEIQQTVYWLCRAKQISEKVCNNLFKSV